ncbi:serine/threonine-protein phosphatase 1 regulatory subunit 10-like [Dermochelys coriacea]|uniref:serine/threonine-protein phosphatase 1 regulatory subunit 10-like n=1 Tax=Dermochelys coriacea TaxID=27794 RepID=UPI0018E84D0E|nr:serine/threonine-protein phosphatase 1 regulatory subunit 10-like [Dermochelys coriacea]XP_043353016.1 serine/threonine-protein phosphatase 1 regulatory subunit 10-like [Dermochelys coriacea]XP_043353017.1 serine/threonine-protein phosphatase 1 regulatory subunit 10-like [Dermochelys coriacea]
MEVDQPGTPMPAVEVPELMETTSSEQNSDTKPPESAADSTQLTKKGKKKTVSWPEESKLWEYFYFELDETEQINMNKIKDFGEAAKWEMLKDREAFETARWLSHDAMEEQVPWVYPKLIDLPSPLVQPGSGSCEQFTQAEREKGILQEIFLSKESIPDSPHEPNPPKLIPLNEIRLAQCSLPCFGGQKEGACCVRAGGLVVKTPGFAPHCGRGLGVRAGGSFPSSLGALPALCLSPLYKQGWAREGQRPRNPSAQP